MNEVFWNGSDGAVKADNKYNLLTTKPDVAGVTFDKLAFSTDFSVSYKVIGRSAIPLTKEETDALTAYSRIAATVDQEAPSGLHEGIQKFCPLAAMDDLKPSGWYYVQTAGADHPAGDGAGWAHYYTQASEEGVIGLIRQLFYPLTDHTSVYARTYKDSAWGNWDDLTDDQNFRDHLVDPDAHRDLRTEMSHVSELANQVASVWTTAVDLSKSGTNFQIPWKYTISDIHDCTSPSSTAMWVSPKGESYDFLLQLGISAWKATAPVAMTVVMMKNGTNVKTWDVVVPTTNVPIYQFEASGITVADNERVHFEVTLATVPTQGALVPYRTYLAVGNHGKVMAQRIATLHADTLGSIIVEAGSEIYIRTATQDATRARVQSSKFNPTIVKAQ